MQARLFTAGVPFPGRVSPPPFTPMPDQALNWDVGFYPAAQGQGGLTLDWVPLGTLKSEVGVDQQVPEKEGAD